MRTSSGPIRHIALEGQSNFRDLGGYETDAGRRVRYRQVFRSGRLSQLTDQDLETLEALGIRTVVNLLTSDDVKEYGADRVPSSATLVHLPIDSETATELATRARRALATGDFSLIPPEINAEIHRLLVEDGRDQYGELIRLLTDPANRPLVFHCSHGIHRTGAGAAIVLSLLGVDWDIVRRDYLRSNELRAGEVHRRLEQMVEAVAATRDVSPGEIDMANMEAFMVQDASYIDASRDQIMGEFGSFDRYAREGLGVDATVVQSLRDELLD